MPELVLGLDGILAGYGATAVVREVSLSLRSGDSMLVIGHNGAGKSTLLKTLFALLRPIGGSGRVCGVPLDGADPTCLAKAGARFLGQGTRSFDHLSVREHRAILA